MNYADLSPRLRNALTPTRVAFLASLMLSLAAWATSTINRDGMLYVDTARIFLDQGFAAAKASFAWPFLPILIALVGKLTGLPLEAAGYLLNALFMAGASAFLVSAAGRANPQAAWAICLVALALPGVNEYRNELLREFGAWFFIMAAFWLAQRWAERPTWLLALGVQGLIGVAALFRPEAVAMIGALTAWQLFSAPKGSRLLRGLMIGGLIVAGVLTLIALFVAGYFSEGSRIYREFSRFNVASFNAKAEAMSEAFYAYARGQARTILFFGSLAIIPLKLVHKLGILLVPLLYLHDTDFARKIFRRHSLYAWGFVVHAAVLAVFVLDLQFISGRYFGPMLLCAAPFIGSATWRVMERGRLWRASVIVALTMLMLGSTISLSGGKTTFADAGKWLEAHTPPSARVFVGSGRTAYYAGSRFRVSNATKNMLSAAWRDNRYNQYTNMLSEALRENRYDLYVLEVARGNIELTNWIEQSGLQVVERFSDTRGGAVIILSPKGDRPLVTPTGK